MRLFAGSIEWGSIVAVAVWPWVVAMCRFFRRQYAPHLFRPTVNPDGKRESVAVCKLTHALSRPFRAIAGLAFEVKLAITRIRLFGNAGVDEVLFCCHGLIVYWPSFAANAESPCCRYWEVS